MIAFECHEEVVNGDVDHGRPNLAAHCLEPPRAHACCPRGEGYSLLMLGEVQLRRGRLCALSCCELAMRTIEALAAGVKNEAALRLQKDMMKGLAGSAV